MYSVNSALGGSSHQLNVAFLCLLVEIEWLDMKLQHKGQGQVGTILYPILRLTNQMTENDMVPIQFFCIRKVGGLVNDLCHGESLCTIPIAPDKDMDVVTSSQLHNACQALTISLT